MTAAFPRPRAASFKWSRFVLYLVFLACLSLYSLFPISLDALRPTRQASIPELKPLEAPGAAQVTQAQPAPAPVSQSAPDPGLEQRLEQLQINAAQARVERGMLAKKLLDQAKQEQAKNPGVSLEQALRVLLQTGPAALAQAKVAQADRELSQAMRLIPPQPQVQAMSAPTETPFTVLRLGRPAEEVRRILRPIGLPWFLRRLGATGAFDDSGGQISIEVAVQGRKVGRYVERLVPIDADRSKLLVDFVPADAILLGHLVASLKTVHDPVTLMRAVMFEHTRSSVAGEDFNPSVLVAPPNTSGASFLEKVNAIGTCPAPQTDNFPLCERDQQAANIRHAGERGGR